MTDNKPVRIIRTKHDKEHPYFMLARVTVQNTDISYEALGILVYLLSKPDDWVTRLTDLQKRKHGKKSAYGRDVIARVMKELVEAGYLKLEHHRTEDNARLVGSSYVVSETLEFRQPEIQTVGKITPLQSTDDLQSTEKKTTPRKRDEIFDTIARVWKISAPGYIGQMKSMMLGTAKKGTWKDCNFDTPATSDEIAAFEAYAHKRMVEKNIHDMPTAAVTIQRWFYDFRADVKKASEPVTPAKNLEQMEINRLMMREANGTL